MFLLLVSVTANYYQNPESQILGLSRTPSAYGPDRAYAPKLRHLCGNVRFLFLFDPR